MGFSSGEDSASVNSAKRARGARDCWHHDDEGRAEALLEALRDASHVFLDESPTSHEIGLPEWFDEQRYHRGVETFEKNIFSMMCGKMSGLLSLLAVPSIVRVLVLTKKSNDPDTAFRRYVDTTRHMLMWYRSNLSDPESPARQSITTVGRHHLRASSAAQRAGMGKITQLDLALTQFAFCGYPVVRRTRLGVKASPQELLDFLHIWKTIGFLMGIEDRFNVCRFDTDLTLSEEVFQGICRNWLAPALASPPREFKSMSRALLAGLWCMMPVLEYESYVSFTQELADVAVADRIHPSSRYGSCMQWLLYIVPSSLNWPIIGNLCRAYHNNSMRFSLYMSTYYPLLAWYSFPGNNNTKYNKLVPNET